MSQGRVPLSQPKVRKILDTTRDVRLSGPQPMIKNLLWDECKTVEIRFKGAAPIA